MNLNYMLDQVPEVLGTYTSTMDTDVMTELLAGGLFAGTMAIFVIFTLIFALALGIGAYIYTSLAIKKIAEKENLENTWYAWVPVLKMTLLIKIAEMDPNWIIAYIASFAVSIFSIFLAWVPIFGTMLTVFNYLSSIALTVLGVIIYMKVCEKRGKDKLLGLLMLVPIANYVLLGILAWGKDE